VLQEVLRDLSVECLPRDIPEAIDIDVEELDVGQSVHVSDVSVPNVTVLNDAELVVCTVAHPTVEALPEGAVAEEGIGEVEPEVIRARREDAEADRA
jgi:large subunit ribosomal protein L25